MGLRSVTNPNYVSFSVIITVLIFFVLIVAYCLYFTSNITTTICNTLANMKPQTEAKTLTNTADERQSEVISTSCSLSSDIKQNSSFLIQFLQDKSQVIRLPPLSKTSSFTIDMTKKNNLGEAVIYPAKDNFLQGVEFISLKVLGDSATFMQLDASNWILT